MKPWLLLLLSACMAGLSYLAGGLAYIALVPLFVLLFRAPKAVTFGKGMCFGFLYAGIGFHWLISLYPLDFLDFSPLVGLMLIVTAWLLISLCYGLMHGLLFVGCRRLSVGGWQDGITYACLWMLTEWIQGVLLFPFLTLAVTQASFPSVIQSISLFGSFFLTFLIALCNAGLAYFVVFRKKRVFLSVLLIFTVNIVGGAITLHSTSQEDSPLKVALIQGNIPSNQKWQENTSAIIFDTYQTLTARAIKEQTPDIVIWPETVLPVSLNDTRYLEELQKTAISHRTPLIIGGFYYDAQKQKDYNCMYYIHADGRMDLPIYAKRELVPFGEFLPFRNTLSKLFPVLGDINASGSDLTPGTKSIVNELSGVGKFGSLICFDSLFPQIAKESVNAGAQLLLLSTNDSWFEDSTGVYLHRNHAVLRAVENQRWIARAANTGISCFISPKGEVFESLPPLTEGYTVYDVALQNTSTLYSRTGDIILWLGGCYLIMIGRKKQWKIF